MIALGQWIQTSRMYEKITGREGICVNYIDDLVEHPAAIKPE